MRETIQDVRIGQKVENHLNGIGMITDKTKRTITVTFESGLKVKNTYTCNDAYFYPTDF